MTCQLDYKTYDGWIAQGYKHREDDDWLNLCSGGEIGRQAVKELGLPVTNWFSSEIDKFAIKVAKDNHDDINHLGDIKNIMKILE